MDLQKTYLAWILVTLPSNGHSLALTQKTKHTSPTKAAKCPVNANPLGKVGQIVVMDSSDCVMHVT